MFFCLPFMQKCEEMKGMECRPAFYRWQFGIWKTSHQLGCTSEASNQTRAEAVATSSVASPAKKHIKTPCSVSVTLLLRDYRKERITVRVQQIASRWRRTVGPSSFQGAAREVAFCLFVSSSEGVAGRLSWPQPSDTVMQQPEHSSSYHHPHQKK